MTPHFEQWLHRYRLDYERKSLSAAALKPRLSSLRVFVRFLCEVRLGDVALLRETHVTAFRAWLFHDASRSGAPRQITSQNRVLIETRHFLHFLFAEGGLSRDLSGLIELAKEPQRLPRNILTPREARTIIKTCDLHTALGYRDRTLLEVMYSTGIRRAELLSLILADIRLEEEVLRINGGKGAKDRVVPLTRAACAFLETYVRRVRPALLRNKRTTERVFVSLKGGGLSFDGLARLIARCARRAGIKQRVTPHVWRHTCATHLLQNQANLRHVQEILGHRSLATTERYLHVTIADLKAAHRRCHPREREG